MVRLSLALGALLCLTTGSVGQQTPVPGAKLSTPPTIDGTVSPEEWSGASTFSGLVDEATGAASPEGGQFWIAYDKDYIYFAAKLADSQPGSIAATEHRTNVSLAGDDNVGLQLDLSGSLADFNSFSINPNGATDINLSGGRAAKREWSGEFLAKGRITSEGWECEARIPWQVMRMPSAAGTRTLRFNVRRRHSRTSRTSVWAFTNNGFAPQNTGRWTAVDMPKGQMDRSIKLLPYTYLGYGKEENLISNSGVDIKTQLLEEVPLVISVNPDFRNIERGVLSLDFSRFERLAGETRPFFQEGAAYFNSALFASQRVKGFDAGLNVHGKVSNPISFGILDTMDFGNEHSFVGNVTFDPNPRDSVRLTATSHSKGAEKNDAWLLRYNLFQGHFNFFARTMGTKDSQLGPGVWNTVSGGWAEGPHQFYAGYDSVSPNFIPRLGFAPETDYKGPNVYYGFNQPIAKGPISEVQVDLSAIQYDFFDGGFYRNQFSPGFGLTMRGGAYGYLATNTENFMGSKDQTYSIFLGYPRGSMYNSTTFNGTQGVIAGEHYRSLSVTKNFRPIKDFQVSASYQRVDFMGKSDQAIVGLNYDIGHDQSVAGRVIKRDRDWNCYLAFRRSGNAGTEYFIILGDPNSQTFTKRLIAKVTVPFKIG